MDLSWSYNLKADAPTIVKSIKNDVKSHMEFISHHMRKFENVGIALNEGQIMLGDILCRKCKDAVRSKNKELHSKNGATHDQKKPMKLSQERQQIVNEITNILIQLERSQNKDEGDVEYVTEEEYYRREMSEMESKYRNKLFDKQDEIRDMEKKCKEINDKMIEVDKNYNKDVQDKKREVEKYKKDAQDKMREVEKYKKEAQYKETAMRNLRTQLETMTNGRNDYKRKHDTMSTKLQSYDRIESELRELKKEQSRLKEDTDQKERTIKGLNRELETKEEDNKRYRSSPWRYKTRLYAADSRDEEAKGLKDKLNYMEEEISPSRKEKQNLTSERVTDNAKLQAEMYNLKETIDHKDEDLQTSRKEDESLQHNIPLREKNCSLLEMQDHKDEDMQTSKKEDVNSQHNRTLREEKCSSLEMQDAFDTMQMEKDEYQKAPSQLQKVRKIDPLTKTTEELASTVDSLQRDVDRVTRELDEKQSELDAVEHLNQRYVKHMSQLRKDKKTLQDQINSITTTKKDMASGMEDLERNIATLKGELEEKQDDFDKVQKEKAERMKELSQLQTEVQTLQNEMCSLSKTNKEISSNMKGLERHIDRLERQHDKKDEEINKMKASLEECRRMEKKVVVMRLMRSSQSGMDKDMVDMVIKELTRLLEGRVDSKSIEFSIVPSETSTDISNGPLFVVCLSMSRDGRDIQNTLGESKGGTDVYMYMLVIHHIDKELTPTRHHVTGSEGQQPHKIIDMAFSGESGLYECNININAIEKIVAILKKF